MKRIKIETVDKTYFAKALTFRQLRENKELIDEIAEEGERISETGNARVPYVLLSKQAVIVLIALKNHDPNVTEEVLDNFSLQEITGAFSSVLSGSGYVEVGEGNAAPGESR